jgi:GNAT superfamily N-acetyltransferase
MTVDIRHEPPDGPASRALFDEYMALTRERIPGFTPSEDIFATADAFRGPGSAWIVLYEDGTAVGCGGLRMVAPEVGEIKRMYVRAHARGRGHGRRLLGELEAIAGAAGLRRIRLLTTEVLAEAIELYRSVGYEVASEFELDGRRDFWLERRI